MVHDNIVAEPGRAGCGTELAAGAGGAVFAQADDAGADGSANVPARSAGSSLIWQNPKSTLRHLPQRHLRLLIASMLQSGF